MDGTKDFLGTGWAFPVDVDRATGMVRMSSYEKDIEESVRIILGTKRGERLMNPRFGNDLHEYIFAVRDYTTENLIRREVVECLTIWEPRITDISAEVEFTSGQDGGFIIELSYTVRGTNNPYNLVYPFYITEGIP